MPTIVKAKKDESKYSLISRFKKLILDGGDLDEMRERRYYVSPSQKKKEARKEKKKRDRRSRKYS
jgi:ribosomal protein S21